MEESWENLCLQMEMDDGNDFLEISNTCNDDEDEELFLREILLQPSFSSESDESDYHQFNHSFNATTNSYSTLLPNTITTIGSDVPMLDQTARNMVKSNSSNSLVSQKNDSKKNNTNKKKPHKSFSSSSSSPRTYILSFDNSTVTPATPEPEPYPKNNDKLVKGSEGISHSSCNNNNSPNLPLERTTMDEPRLRVRDDSANNNNHGPYKKIRTSSQTMDHIMAERKRRQELTERFIALSATIPGLSKTDKASILRAAIDYVKQLQERVQELEKQEKLKRSVESSVILVRNSNNNINEDTITTSSVTTISSEENCGTTLLPEIEARVMGKEVLIEIHCEKGNGIELQILDKLENLHLCVTGCSVLPFGNSALGITIIAQMGESYNMGVNDIVKHLREVVLMKKNPITEHGLQK